MPPVNPGAAREVGNEILRQLGGPRFSAMTGARNFVALPDGLQFDVPVHSTRDRNISRISIKLRGDDTYTVAFLKWKSRDLDFAIIAVVSQIHVEQLRATFTQHTGLETSL